MADEKNNTEEQSEALKTISYVKKLLPEVGKLSMFNDEQKKTKGNKVLANVYDYVMESLTNSDTEQVSTMTSNKIMKLTNKTVNEIDWMGELVSLLDVGVEALTIYENNYDEENPASGLFHMLDADNPNKDANKTALETIINNLSKSEILGLALSTSFVNDMLVEALSSVVEGVVLPTEVNYVRELNADEMAQALMNETNRYGVGWNIRIKPPREEGEDAFMRLPVKISTKNRIPAIYLNSAGNVRRLDEDTMGIIDDMAIRSVNLDIRPYDGEIRGEAFRSAYLDSIEVIQEIDRFTARYAEEEYPEE
jgi:hypothetical protein